MVSVSVEEFIISDIYVLITDSFVLCQRLCGWCILKTDIMAQLFSDKQIFDPREASHVKHLQNV